MNLPTLPAGVNPFAWIVATSAEIRARDKAHLAVREIQHRAEVAAKGKQIAKQEAQFAADRRARRA